MTLSDDLVTVAEAAKILHRSIEQVRRYLREGKLSGQRIGQQWFVPRSEVSSTEKTIMKKTTIYEQRMQLLQEVREAREQIYATSGTLGDGADTIRQIREERDEELEQRLP